MNSVSTFLLYNSPPPTLSFRVTLIVDGINHPYTGGSFVELCERGFYNQVIIDGDDSFIYIHYIYVCAYIMHVEKCISIGMCVYKYVCVSMCVCI